ncbi:MAG: peptide MFS transporter [Acidobacteriota bacterium]|nr:peptide MFS transporter [Acidobacteriota bacterium]
MKFVLDTPDADVTGAPVLREDIGNQPEHRNEPQPRGSSQDRTGIAGHPAGLTTLFLTEMWERFSYYGMRALLVLYMVAPLSGGGLGFDVSKATRIYGMYTGAVYFTNIFGGVLADRFFGARLAVLLGGIIIACGHFSMAFHALPTLYAGMILIVLGTGLLKPNISVMVGNLYDQDDPRRDSGFSIFYMGINLGAMIAPLICGYIGQRISWHLGFAMAGVGMTMGLIQYVVHRKRLVNVGARPAKKVKVATGNEVSSTPSLTREDKRRLLIVVMLCFFAVLFWTAFEQAGSSFNLFAERQTRTEFLGFNFPSSFFQSVNSIFILTLAPIFSLLWLRLGRRQPSSSAKFAAGLFFVSVGMFIIAIASLFIGGTKVSPLWLVAVYFIHTIGELCLSPVGLSTVTKLSPLRMVGMMMGVWFLAASIGNYLAGTIAGFYQDNSNALFRLFGGLGVATLVGAVLLFLLVPFVRRLTAQETS